MLTDLEHGLVLAVHIHQHPPQPKPRRSALLEAPLNQLAGSLKHLRGKLSAVFPGHRPLNALDDRRCRAAVVFKLLAAVVNRHAGLPAYVVVESQPTVPASSLSLV